MRSVTSLHQRSFETSLRFSDPGRQTIWKQVFQLKEPFL
jgi:hypothetical protein